VVQQEVDGRTSGVAARRAGLKRRELTLSEVDRRRTQLWTISLFVVAGMTLVVTVLALGKDFLPEALRLEAISEWVVLVLVVGLILAFLVYVVEKEASLRRLSRLLVEERDKTARLEEMDRLRSDFVATVSHELKTPLTAIIGAAKTVGRRGHTMNDEQHAKFMDMIERQGTRLLRMVEDVLDTTRIESGGHHLRRELVNLRELAINVIEDQTHTQVGRGRAIELLTEPYDPKVWGDQTALQQVLGNLLENALKYSDETTTVTVTVKETPSESYLEVYDQGQGISPEQIRTIFDRFRQADSTPGRGAGGFGLGLYIVKNLVASHRGDVEVESEVGKGSVFRVRLPKRAADATERGRSDVEGAHSRRRARPPAPAQNQSRA
jgi:signal transduction histidine kinase